MLQGKKDDLLALDYDIHNHPTKDDIEKHTMRDLAGEILPENVNNDHLFGLATGGISGCFLTSSLLSIC